MTKWGLVAAIAALALSRTASAESRYLVTVDPQHRPEGFEKLHVSRAALGGAEVSLWANSAIDPDCKEHPPGATLTVVKPPQHGTVRISNDPLYLAFPPANPRSACNKQKIPGHEALYAANPGFTGHDKVVLQGSSPDGRAREVIVDITVR